MGLFQRATYIIEKEFVEMVVEKTGSNGVFYILILCLIKDKK